MHENKVVTRLVFPEDATWKAFLALFAAFLITGKQNPPIGQALDFETPVNEWCLKSPQSMPSHDLEGSIPVPETWEWFRFNSGPRRMIIPAVSKQCRVT